MADPYHRYGAPAERGRVARSTFPGYLSSEAPSLLSDHTSNLQSYSSDFLRRDKALASGPYGIDDSVGSSVRSDSSLGVTAGSRLYDPLEATYRSQRPDVAKSLASGPYAIDDTVGSRVRPDPDLGVTAGTSLYNPLEAPNYLSQRQDVAIRSMTAGDYGVDAVGVSVRGEPGLGVTARARTNGYPSPLGPLGPLGAQASLSQRHEVAVSVSSSVPTDIRQERSASRNADGLPVLKGESNILFVDGLPTDCTRREVGHLFRPFIGFKEIKVVHKEPRRSGDKAMVLCFVEFADPDCALTAMEALQGYKFDDKKPDSLPLRIHFAHFPFRLPSDSYDKRIGIPH